MKRRPASIDTRDEFFDLSRTERKLLIRRERILLFLEGRFSLPLRIFHFSRGGNVPPPLFLPETVVCERMVTSNRSRLTGCFPVPGRRRRRRRRRRTGAGRPLRMFFLFFLPPPPRIISDPCSHRRKNKTRRDLSAHHRPTCYMIYALLPLSRGDRGYLPRGSSRKNDPSLPTHLATNHNATYKCLPPGSCVLQPVHPPVNRPDTPPSHFFTSYSPRSEITLAITSLRYAFSKSWPSQ